jgi:hypothetical protein
VNGSLASAKERVEVVPFKRTQATTGKQKMCPLLSVVTPTFNEGGFIEENVLSVT